MRGARRMPPFECGRCRRSVPDDGPRYRAVIEIAHVADPLVLTEEDLARDFRREIRDLLARMASRSARAMEEEVYVRKEVAMCGPCRRDLLQALAGTATPSPRRQHPRRRRRRRA